MKKQMWVCHHKNCGYRGGNTRREKEKTFSLLKPQKDKFLFLDKGMSVHVLDPGSF